MEYNVKSIQMPKPHKCSNFHEALMYSKNLWKDGHSGIDLKPRSEKNGN